MIFDGIVHRTLAAAMDFGRVVHGDVVVIQAGAGGSTNLNVCLVSTSHLNTQKKSKRKMKAL